MLYESLVKGLTHKLNPIKYALLTILASRQHANIDLSIEFLDEAKVRLESYKDAVYLCRIAQAEKKLNLGLHHDCLQILNEVKGQVEADSDIDPKVYANLSEVFANYYRRKEDQENFYKSSLQFLAYTPANELSAEDKKQWSIKMGMAVLLGKNIFNIAELLDKEILNSLVGSDFQWLYDLLMTLGRGQITEFTAAIQKYQDFVSRFPAIMKEMSYLDQKVRILAFLELLFNCGKDERCLTFTQLAAHCKVQVNEVEMLVMKAMSLELVRGSIDEVDQTVQIDWIMPRYLSMDHLAVLVTRMDEWDVKMENIIRTVENGSAEIIQDAI